MLNSQELLLRSVLFFRVSDYLRGALSVLSLKKAMGRQKHPDSSPRGNGEGQGQPIRQIYPPFFFNIG